jgi:4-amino-4-deoxy-L-arabinose transferase-like glycosyltransferase
MPLTELIQTLIHKLEVGAGSRYLRYLALAVAVFALGFFYDFRAYRNLGTPEAMDAAQLARNISEGKGYTTLFIRPFSLYLVQAHNSAQSTVSLTNANPDLAEIKSAHPDLANAPVYPFVLAGLMKTVKFQYPVNMKKAFWTNNGNFWRYQPDFYIAIFNEALLLVVVMLTFFLAKKLFDSNVAWLSAILVLGCELLWKFSVSGLSTILLLVIFLTLTMLLLEIERSARESQPRAGRLVWLALTAGILTGIGALTRYAFGWTIFPIAVFLILFSGHRRLVHLFVALAAFALVMTPWIMRNEMVSGTAFGTAGYAAAEGTSRYPLFQLERSLHPELVFTSYLKLYALKFFANVQGILTGDLLKIGGGWTSVLFFAGLFMGFRSTGARRLRYFLLMWLGLFIVVQSLGRTQLSDLSPEINSENLLVLLVPLVVIFGTSFFFTLLDQMTLPLVQLRYAVVGGFVAICCLPMLSALIIKSDPRVYPPYYPVAIQLTANWMKPDELMMSDIPWAVAWYGQRQCIWLTLDAQTEFFAVNDYLKPVQALYLTPLTMDSRFITDWVKAREFSWGSFIIDSVVKNKIPPTFPLRVAEAGFLPDQLFLTDRERWITAQ